MPGSLDIPDTSAYQLKKEDLATTMTSVPCFLVVHPKGAMMWDTGAVPDSAFKPGGGPATQRYAMATKPLTAQLAEVGYAPADIKYLALSHFHWDHVGNCNLFASATLAGAQGRTGHHVRRAAFFAHGACKLQRAQG
jgi:glyoxylase-like metal-dependent hydrolase (beta-lactamase superfamily II)